tara:strand:+ start:7820 stop:8035 length:216 start_codon:yes stop_codon:yes gene_type:complete
MKPFEFEINYIDNVQYKGQEIEFDINIMGGTGIENSYEIFFHSIEFSEEEQENLTEVIQNKYKEIIEKLWN